MPLLGQCVASAEGAGARCHAEGRRHRQRALVTGWRSWRLVHGIGPVASETVSTSVKPCRASSPEKDVQETEGRKQWFRDAVLALAAADGTTRQRGSQESQPPSQWSCFRKGLGSFLTEPL